MAKVISRINSVNDGVLVCIDEEKDIYKYLPLDQVKIGSQTLKQVFKSYDGKIANLTKRITDLENWKKPAAALLAVLANEEE